MNINEGIIGARTLIVDGRGASSPRRRELTRHYLGSLR